ncbi:glycoside hydrolase family 9 protein [Actinoplanes sp. NBRC 103695]|uniref:glycoside hydrolase family 9 protein n=1 Tax=Actinoplanes sp. NBRC 103695 TaxID=3032202 RepID=UPI00249FF4EE|nr:glycoside hydrolase family 9 protein [Actinoplanes sp. NBRC 103695]GLY97376.1 endoglucanase [Actinoplanes sp. NBRC 103695]
MKILAFLAAALVAVTPGVAYADETDLIINGGFDTEVAPWWSSAQAPITLVDGRACVDIPGGTTNRWDIVVGQNDIPLVAGETYRFEFFATGTSIVRAVVSQPDPPYATYFEESPLLSAAGDDHVYTFTSTVTGPSSVQFQLGGSPTPWRFCLDDVAFVKGATPIPYEPDTGPAVRVNQVAYLPDGPKNATLVSSSPTPVRWELRNRRKAIVDHGLTKPRGKDVTSGQDVHSIDFSRFRGRGTGFELTAAGETSRPFDIDPSAYERLRADSLKFYYTQRSGIAISDELRPGYARPAGHVDVAPNQGDGNVPCQAGVCDYRLDVTGGWYDAGDHGKYVVNGGISAWQLMNLYERRHGNVGLAIPESGDRTPDILDEVRWELDFLLEMQVPAGQPLAGMVHHKIHDRAWTGLPLLPHLDPQPRELHPVSTAATLNLAATAAQAARLYRRYDRAFADRSLAAARTAFAAAVANPDRLASPDDGTGGGAYSDAQVGDEFYWAAVELYLTTGSPEYADRVLASPFHTADVFGPGAFDWGNTAAAARLDLATVPSKLPGRARVVRSVVQGADKYVAVQRANPYAIPYAPANNSWDWGSNSLVLNNLSVIGTAYDLTRRPAYRDAVVEGMDYILGRNALNYSYVTGYGEAAAHNQHSRWYAHQLDPTLPNPPAGTLAGGPNSSLQDPYAQSKLAGCVGQFCYIDDIQSWSTNELTINWNSSLAWVASFVADQNAG